MVTKLGGVGRLWRRAIRALRVRAADEYQRAEIFRSEGARIGSGCRLLVRDLGSEPYLISIGEDCLVSSDVLFATHDGATWVGRDRDPDLVVFGPIRIGDRCFIGARSILLPDTVIGDRCIVAAGAIVRGHFGDGVVLAGVPARVIGSTDDFLERAAQRSLGVPIGDREQLRTVLESRFGSDHDPRKGGRE
jgi:acetyltransferase-like isoleucine patch superfamily enzyme